MISSLNVVFDLIFRGRNVQVVESKFTMTLIHIIDLV